MILNCESISLFIDWSLYKKTKSVKYAYSLNQKAKISYFSTKLYLLNIPWIENV